MRCIFIISVLLNSAAFAIEVTPVKLAEVRERLLKVAEVGEELSKDARASNDSGGKAHPKLEHCQQYFALMPWTFSPKNLTQAVTWPRAEDVPALRALLHDKDSRLRALAIHALGSRYDPEDVPFIAELLNDSASGPVALAPFFFYRTARVLKDEETLALNCEWKVRPVSEHAQNMIEVITGNRLTSESFPKWWALNNNSRECLWYWQQLICRERMWLNTPTDKLFQEKPEVLKKWSEKMLQTFATLPPEVEAKILLVAKDFPGCSDDRWHPSGIFESISKLRISKEHILELLEQRNVWPDVELIGDNYDRLFERVFLCADTFFAGEKDSVTLNRILELRHETLPASAIEAACTGITRIQEKLRAPND